MKGLLKRAALLLIACVILYHLPSPWQGWGIVAGIVFLFGRLFINLFLEHL